MPYAANKLRRVQSIALDEFTLLRDVTTVTPKSRFLRHRRCISTAVRILQTRTYMGTSSHSSLTFVKFSSKRLLTSRMPDVDTFNLTKLPWLFLCDPAIRKMVEDAGQEPDHLIDLYIDSINEAVAGAPTDVSTGAHMCRGNFKGHYLASGGYESVAERFFSRTMVNHFLLEYDTRPSA